MTAKKNRRKTIRKKITILLLFSVLTVLFVTSLLAVWNLRAMKDIFGKQSQELGQTAAADTELAMEDIIGGHLLDTAVKKAALIEEKLDAIVADVNGIVRTAEKIYAAPDEYPDREIPLPVAGSRELAVQLMWSERLARAETEGTVMPKPTAQEEKELKKLANIQDMLVQFNAGNNMISSVYIATETGWMIQADYISYSKYSGDNTLPDYYEANERQWYARALESEPGNVVYSDVIADIHEGRDCIVCSKAVYLDGEAVAVAGIGSYIDVINEEVLATTIGDTGYAFLVNDKGQILVSGAKEGETSVSSDGLTDLRNSKNSELAAAAKNMVAGGSGLVRLTLDGREAYLAYAPLDNSGWSFVTVIDADEVLAPAIENQNMILALTDDICMQVDSSITRILICFVAAAFIMSLLSGLAAVSFGKKISGPIQELTREVAITDGGNLDSRLVLKTGDEVEDLAIAFNKMRTKLRMYIANLAKVTSEKERIHAELSIAREIQRDMLPDSDRMLFGREEYSLYAAAYPAREVGGDFYDFFLTDMDHLVFLVADVSGKGVSAALFMVMAKTLIENQLLLGKTPAEVFESVNHMLCGNNRNGMFLTAWMGVLELSTGNLAYVNAGHNCPLWYCKDTGKYTWLTEVSGFVLAGMDGMKYEQKSMRLGRGDKLFVYSDGVPEANDADEEMYGNERLEAFLTEQINRTPKELCMQLKADLDKFQGTAEQFDDITMLSLEYRGCEADKVWSCKPDVDGQIKTAEELREYLIAENVKKKDICEVMIVFDEIYSNICYHGNADFAVVRCRLDEKEICLEFEDDGKAFDPSRLAEPDVNAPIVNRKEGGLGIYIVKNLADSMEYSRKDNRNLLTITKAIN